METVGASDLRELFTQLSREPDLDAPELQAYDATDELLLAQDLGAQQPSGPVIIGDRHGALTLGAATLGWRGIRVHQDPLLGERALARNTERLFPTVDDLYTSHALDDSLLVGARLVLMQLPKSLDELDEIAWSIARWADPEVRVFAGGRVKHMTRAQNDVLARYFGDVSAGLARRKSRVLSASQPRDVAGSSSWPRWGNDPELSFELAAHGATFGGAKLDHGSRLLLNTLRDDATMRHDAGLPKNVNPTSRHNEPTQDPPRRIVDLGCGNGTLAVWAAKRWPEAHVIATDQSAAAVAATRATAEAAGVLVTDCDHAADPPRPGVCVHRADATEAVPDGWADLILLNPPFHSGSTVHAGVAHRLIRACGSALAATGELRIVFNSHLRYRQIIERAIGPTRQLARDRTFTVLAAVNA